MKTLIAKTQTGIEIKCEVEIDENGNIKTEYPIVHAKNSKMGLRGYSIELTDKEVEKICGRKPPVKKINVMLADENAWTEMKKEAEKIKKEIERAKSIEIWNEMLKRNETLKLWKASASCGERMIIGLPDALKDKEALLLKNLEFDWDMKEERFIFMITAQELSNVIEKAEKKDDEAKKQREVKITGLKKEARETGKPVELSRWTENCPTPEIDCDIDTVIEYIKSDGSIIRERHHSY